MSDGTDGREGGGGIGAAEPAATPRTEPGLGDGRAADPAQGARRTWRNDIVGPDPAVGPVAAWLLGAIVVLIGWLTVTFADNAVQSERDALISRETGWLTIALVAVVAVVAAFEPPITRIVAAIWRELVYRFWRLPSLLRWPLLPPIGLVIVLWRAPSVLFSALDTVLVRVVAPAAGATRSGVWPRWSHFLLVVLGACASGLFAPAPWGLTGVGLGLAAALAMARRWSWVEADRETFLIERGVSAARWRVGFDEDLRDEALIGLCFLFVLAPLTLFQLQEWTCATQCAFTPNGAPSLADDPFGGLLQWMGFFGAELAKAVPFVDWSEVFHVANGSPIGPESAFGSQVVFVLRATLDLLLLSALLQAVSIAVRLRDQWAAFTGGALPILEPFTEVRVLEDVTRARRDEVLELVPTEDAALEAFKAYDAARLYTLIEERPKTEEARARWRTSVALLQRLHPTAFTDEFFTKRLAVPEKAGGPDAAMRDWIGRVSCGLASASSVPESEREARLIDMVSGRSERVEATRAAAARALGRRKLSSAATSALLERLEGRREGSWQVRAAAAVALAKQGVAEASGPIRALAEAFPAAAPKTPELTAAMAAAYALAHVDPDAEAVARRFAHETLRPHARRAARISRTLLEPTPGGPSVPSAGDALDRMVRIPKGTFTMGSPDSDSQAADWEKTLRREVTIGAAFALGRYAVTMSEYGGFCAATGAEPSRYASNGNWPALEVVSWRDAVAYCAWLTAITGERWRLPSETEWEYACRAGTETRYSWGDEGDEAVDGKATSNRVNQPTPVGTYASNPWGLYDMHGNVNEWCADPWSETDLDDAPRDQSARLRSGDFAQAVLRGGSWGNSPLDLRSTLRGRRSRVYRGSDIGFRVARTLLP